MESPSGNICLHDPNRLADIGPRQRQVRSKFALFDSILEETTKPDAVHPATSTSPTKFNMRVLQVLAVAALSISTVVAKKSPSAFDVYHKKQSPITLTEQTHDEITSAPRDYYAAVLLTALDAKYACGICREFQPEWDLLAKSWQKGDKKGEHRLLFGTLDFDQGRNVFVKV